jgi:hypothetical protein
MENRDLPLSFRLLLAAYREYLTARGLRPQSIHAYTTKIRSRRWKRSHSPISGLFKSISWPRDTAAPRPCAPWGSSSP